MTTRTLSKRTRVIARIRVLTIMYELSEVQLLRITESSDALFVLTPHFGSPRPSAGEGLEVSGADLVTVLSLK